MLVFMHCYLPSVRFLQISYPDLQSQGNDAPRGRSGHFVEFNSISLEHYLPPEINEEMPRTGPLNDFIPPDPQAATGLIRSASGKLLRQKVKDKIKKEVMEVHELDEFKPPASSHMLRFY